MPWGLGVPGFGLPDLLRVVPPGAPRAISTRLLSAYVTQQTETYKQTKKEEREIETASETNGC